MNTNIRISLIALAIGSTFLSSAHAQNRPGYGQFRIQPVRTQPAYVQPQRAQVPAQIPYRPKPLPRAAQQANGRSMDGRPVPVEGTDQNKAGGLQNPGWTDLRRSLGIERTAVTPRALPSTTTGTLPVQYPATTQPLNTPQQTGTRWVPTTAAHANASCDSKVLPANGWVIKERQGNNSCYWELSAEERAKRLPQDTPKSGAIPVSTPAVERAQVVRGSLLRRTAPTRGTLINP